MASSIAHACTNALTDLVERTGKCTTGRRQCMYRQPPHPAAQPLEFIMCFVSPSILWQPRYFTTGSCLSHFLVPDPYIYIYICSNMGKKMRTFGSPDRLGHRASNRN